MIIPINEPIWNGRKVGIDEAKMIGNLVRVEILYRKADGKRLYPHLLSMNKEQAMTYPVQIRKGVRLRIIPIIDFKVLNNQPKNTPTKEEKQKLNLIFS